MTVWEALRQGGRLLSQVSEEAELDAELLLRHCVGLDRSGIYRRLAEQMSDEQERRYGAVVGRRLVHEPTAYILGHKEFFGLDFEVTLAAIIPRPETELLVELAINFARLRTAGPPPAIADIGTGCGAIAVSIAHTLPDVHVIATDVSADALALAGRNAERHGVSDRIDFRCGDLLAPLDAPADLLVANLPYVRTGDWLALPPEIRDHEPRAALDGGNDGLRVIERLLQQAPACLRTSGALLAEIGDEQGDEASAMAQEVFTNAAIEVRPDLSGRDRVLVVDSLG